MAPEKIPKQPLSRIGLSCSGGGYRAASFHLGAMSYLQRVNYQGKPLLENVKLISTVSGGTITGIIYALQKQKGTPFTEIYNFILNKLKTLDLVKAGIGKLNPDGKWDNNYKRKNLINAFAELYDKEFTEGKTFAEFDVMNSHLEAVVFNSTEFNNGINFRFRNNGTGLFGNYKIQVPQNLAGEVKLSDAMASSSCFTAGFEPIIWPQDFVHANSPNLLKASKQSAPIGIMDGGIYDNQGIESILNHKKNNPEPYFDLVIISDVCSPYMDGYKPTEENVRKGFRDLTLTGIWSKTRKINKWINYFFTGVIVLTGLLPLLNGYKFNGWTGLCIGLSATFLFFFIIKLVALKKLLSGLQKLLNKIGDKIPSFYAEKLSGLKIQEMNVRRIEPLLLDRLNSLLTLILDVFLKVVRRLNYYKLYDNDKYKYRRISNLIRELTEADHDNRSAIKNEDRPVTAGYTANTILNGDYMTSVGPAIKAVAEQASSFGTTLWFTEKEQLSDMLNKLVAAGQFTMCYNLLEYLEILIFEGDNGFTELDEPAKEQLGFLYDQCKTDWLSFKSNPEFMV